jgi:hypothetical protein
MAGNMGAILQALMEKFDPEGKDYDYATAKKFGMGPKSVGENVGHWGSVAPAPEIHPNASMMLKGAGHDTWSKGVFGEAIRGSKVVKIGDRYYSVPEDYPTNK